MLTNRVAGLIAGLVLGIPACGPLPSPTPTTCANTISTDSIVYDTTQVTEQPTRRSGPPPRIDPSAYPDGVQGRVVVVAIIEPTGKASEVLIDKPLVQSLNEASLLLVRESTFWPGCREGTAVRVRVTIPIDWVIAARRNRAA
jgi:hypothetical protein